MDSVCIIQEFNCYARSSWPNRLLLALKLRKSPDLYSIWLAFPPYEHSRDDHDYTEMATKILGPVPTSVAESVVGQLQAAFTLGGMHVDVEVVADD